MLVKPFDGLPMLIGETLGDPNDRDRAERGGIGQELAEMVVVGLSKLIFDNDVIV